MKNFFGARYIDKEIEKQAKKEQAEIERKRAEVEK